MRVQPFSVLGHNGEINTIARLRSEARMLGAPIRDDSSDSQDLNRTGRDADPPPRAVAAGGDGAGACRRSCNEIRQFPEDLRGFYMYLRQAMGPFAQGPIALIARHGDELRVLASTRSACARSGRSRRTTPTCSAPSRASCRSRT